MHGLRFATKFAVLLICLIAVTLYGISQERDKYETIQATAFGTSTQLGQNVPITVIIYRFSTPADLGVLVKAFQQGQNQGLVNALQKSKAVGRIQIPGDVGFDLSYISKIPTPNGRKIRFVASRKIAFGEVLADSRSQSFDLTAGELDMNDQKQNKSTGALFPATQLIINPQGELQFYLYKNPWRLGEIRDSNPISSATAP
jgi:hypothetical protein